MCLNALSLSLSLMRAITTITKIRRQVPIFLSRYMNLFSIHSSVYHLYVHVHNLIVKDVSLALLYLRPGIRLLVKPNLCRTKFWRTPKA